MSSAVGFYRALLTALPSDNESKSNSVHSYSRRTVSEELQSLTLMPSSTSIHRDLSEDVPEVSENANFTNSVFEPNQLIWEISAHTEDHCDQQESRILPELVLTDSSFLSIGSNHDERLAWSATHPPRDAINSPRFLELLTDEVTPRKHENNKIQSPRPSHGVEGVNRRKEVQSRPSCVALEQGFDLQQRVRKATIQVQLELNEIEASRQVMQSTEASRKLDTPRCSVKETVSNSLSKLGRAFYHCCHRKQSKKEEALLRKMRENCSKNQTSPMAPASKSYRQRRNLMLRKRIEGMINSPPKTQPTRSPIDRESLRLDLKKVHDADTGCLPTSGRLTFSGRYRKYKSNRRGSNH